MISDKGDFFPNEETLEEIAYTSNNADFYLRNSSETIFFSMLVYSDKNVQKIQRIYMKFQDLLARLGGILQILIFFGRIFTQFEYSLLLKNTILNALYSFKKQKSLKKKTKNEKIANNEKIFSAKCPLNFIHQKPREFTKN